jgi:DNA-binding NarL/FixJ family response regulator
MIPIRVIIADDHELIIDGLQSTFRGSVEFEIVGEASNGEELLRLTRDLQPDVVLTDIKMPKMDGIEFTKTIKAEFPYIGVIGITSYDEEDLVLDMLNAGANGYLMKTAGKAEISKAIEAVHKGASYYCSRTNYKLAEMISKRNSNPLRKKNKVVFTDRELQVIDLMCEGLSSKEIGSKLGLTKRTIERYRDMIMEKMDVKNVASAVVYAIGHGLYVAPKY